ncbi:MlaD family protein [Patulibacter minatonensis]|uniref:MlaD family protein n=1 Tax=Patulibacter minatonensis TaxID=298163 RepID=UPI0004799C17|nr:MlaD family protein [Patulibacter minatonensis]
MRKLLERYDKPFIVGAVTLIAVLLIIGVAFSGAHKKLFRASGHEITAIFENAQQLRAGDPVRVNGVDSGEVAHIKLRDDARSAVVTMRVEDKAGEVYANARADIQFRSLLGGSMYVSLNRGTADAGELGAKSIDLKRTTAQVELDDVSTIVKGRTKRGLRSLPTELGKAFSDPRDPARGIQELAKVAPDVRRGARALRGVAEGTDLQRLIRNTARTVRALDTKDQGVQNLISGTAATLQTIGNRSADLRALFRDTPAVAARVDQTMDRIVPTLAGADTLLDKLHDPAVDVAPTVQHLRPAVVSADTTLNAARPLLRSLPRATTALAAAAKDGKPLLDELTPSLERLDQKILPNFDKKDPQTGYTVAEMFGAGAGGLAGTTAQRDANGHFIRFAASVGSNPLYGPCQLYFGEPEHKSELLQCQDLSKTVSDVLGPLGLTGPKSAAKGRNR